MATDKEGEGDSAAPPAAAAPCGLLRAIEAAGPANPLVFIVEGCLGVGKVAHISSKRGG